MPATSKAQKRLMGMALAYKRGELSHASGAVKGVAKSMSQSQLRDYAKGKEKGLPEHKKRDGKYR